MYDGVGRPSARSAKRRSDVPSFGDRECYAVPYLIQFAILILVGVVVSCALL
jgi:hypothetical protein